MFQVALKQLGRYRARLWLHYMTAVETIVVFTQISGENMLSCTTSARGVYCRPVQKSSCRLVRGYCNISAFILICMARGGADSRIQYRVPFTKTTVPVRVIVGCFPTLLTPRIRVLPPFLCLGEHPTVQVYDRGCRGSGGQCRAGAAGSSKYRRNFRPRSFEVSPS